MPLCLLLWVVVTMSKDNPVFSSRTWSGRLNTPLPDPLPWDLYELVVEAEFLRRMNETEGTA